MNGKRCIVAVRNLWDLARSTLSLRSTTASAFSASGVGVRSAVQCVAANADGETVSAPVALPLQIPLPKQQQNAPVERRRPSGEKEKEYADGAQAEAPSPARLIVRFDRANRTRRAGQSALLACAPADASHRLTWLRENTPVDQMPQVC